MLKFRRMPGSALLALIVLLPLTGLPCRAQSVADQLNQSLRQGQAAGRPVAPGGPVQQSAPAAQPRAPADILRDSHDERNLLIQQYNERINALRQRAQADPRNARVYRAEAEAIRADVGARLRQINDRSRGQLEAARDAWRQTCNQVAMLVQNLPSPDMASRGTTIGGAPASDLALLVDDRRFMPAFGKPFAQMRPEEFQPLAANLARCISYDGPLAQLGPREKAATTAVLNSSYTGQITGMLQRQHDAVDKIVGMSATLTRLQPTPADYDQLWTIAAQLMNAEFRAMPEAQRAEFERNLATAEDRVAIPIERQRAQDALTSTRGIDGLNTLLTLQAQMQRASQSRNLDIARMEVKSQLAARASAIAAAIAGFEKARIDGFGGGLPGLEKGVAWSRDFGQRYQKLAPLPASLGDLTVYFMARRKDALESAVPVFQREIARTSDADALAQRYLMPMDSKMPAGAVMLAMVRRYDSDQGKWKLLNSNPEQDRRERKNVDGEPTEGEMYDAVMGQMAGMAAGARAMGESCKDAQKSDNPADMIFCLTGMATNSMGAGSAMTLTSFQKIGCVQARDRYGFLCDYRAAKQGGILENKMLGGFMSRLTHGEERSTGLFSRDRNGWTVSDPRQEVILR
jgi:hypothetical protein